MTNTKEIWLVDNHKLSVTHLDKIYWQEEKITKGEMLNYYKTMASVMLPHFRNRPVTLRVFPEGINGFSYYRRDIPAYAPSWLRYQDYKPLTSDEVIRLPLIDNTAGLVWFANQGSIEFHLWSACAPDFDLPDVAVFDLDLGDKAEFKDVLHCALILHDYLEEKGVKSFPKTSGGTGIHVYVPIARKYNFDTVRAWVKNVAETLAASNPKLAAVPHGPTHEGNKISIDYAQNSIGRNTAAPYTLRARPHATVSAPLGWDEVREGGFTPLDFTIHSISQRLKEKGDLFADVLNLPQTLPTLTQS